MARFFALLLCVLPIGSLSATAEQEPILIELFASQNCQACPAAYRTLRSVAEENEDVFILTWGVDYWDYLGEADPMALPEAKARQAGYAEQMSLRAPYTPQSIYNGMKQCPATRRRTVDRHISDLRSSADEVTPRLVQAGNTVSVSERCDAPLDVHLVEYLPEGENSTDMVNPVTSTHTLGQCVGDNVEFTAACSQTCAVILQEPDYGKVLSILTLD